MALKAVLLCSVHQVVSRQGNIRGGVPEGGFVPVDFFAK